MVYKNLLIVTTLLTISSAVIAFDWEFNPYVGIYTQWKHINFKAGFGNNIFTHIYPQICGHLGVKLHENIGVELGYETGKTKTRVTALTTGDRAAGTPIPEIISPAVFRGRGKLKGANLDLVGFYAPFHQNVEFLGFIGVSDLKAKFERHTVQVRGIPYGRSRKLKDHKAVLHLGVGVQFLFCEHFFIRANIGWKNSARMVLFAKDGIAGLYTPEVRLKNSVTYNIGLVWRY